MPRPDGPRGRWLLLAATLDAVAVLLFAALGQRSHDEGSGVVAVLATAAPFLVALAAGWCVILLARLAPTSAVTGVAVWAVTVIGGLVMRRTVWDRGTAASFVVVTAFVLGLLVLGWRAAYTFSRGRGEIRSASPPSKAGR